MATSGKSYRLTFLTWSLSYLKASPGDKGPPPPPTFWRSKLFSWIKISGTSSIASGSRSGNNVCMSYTYTCTYIYSVYFNSDDGSTEEYYVYKQHETDAYQLNVIVCTSPSWWGYLYLRAVIFHFILTFVVVIFYAVLKKIYILYATWLSK
jgi:hypothetical protein